MKRYVRTKDGKVYDTFKNYESCDTILLKDVAVESDKILDLIQVGEYRESDIRGIELYNLHKSNRGNWCFDAYDEHNTLAPKNLFLKDYGKTWALTEQELR